MFSIHTNTRKVAWTLIMIIANQAILPHAAYALTSGPVQPELQSFQPAGTSDMVDLFSGDFSYNIPLFELPGPDGGYPVNLFYNSVTNADQEASFVGLGWNLGIGAVSRSLQGFPDDFNGDEVSRTIDQKPIWSAGVNYNATATGIDELFGIPVGEWSKALSSSATIDSVANNAWDLSLATGVGLLYNSEKGFGYTRSAMASFSLGVGPATLSASAGIELNSLDGVSLNTNLGVKGALGTKNDKNDNNRVKGGLGLSGEYTATSRGSAGFSLSGSAFLSAEKKIKKTEQKTLFSGVYDEFTRNFPTFPPKISVPTAGFSINANIKIASAFQGVYGLGFANTVSGYFTTRHPKHNGEIRTSKAFGSMYAENATQEHLQDFSREKESILAKSQPNLHIPSMGADVLSVTGQGLGGNFQLFRSDIPIFRDQATESSHPGHSIGVDIGPSATPHVALNYGYSINSSSSACALPNLGQIGAHGRSNDNSFENYYYKSSADVVANLLTEHDYMGKDAPVALALTGNYNLSFGNELVANNVNLPKITKGRSNRKTKSTNILPLTNKQLLDHNGQILFPEYKVSYYKVASNGGGAIADYTLLQQESPNRTAKPDHVGGYTVLGAGGAKWIYGLPVKNKVQKDVVMSVAAPNNAGCVKKVAIPIQNGKPNYKINGTEEYYDLTALPEYNHSHLLTSILGADYIDADPSDGLPNAKDNGYWVRFEYVRTSSNFKWRTPFAGANYEPGVMNRISDDKASFSYGEREQFHPAKMISKTHEAYFHYSPRYDARGVNSWLQNNGDQLGDYSYKLDSISIYSINELTAAVAEGRNPIAMKKVHFTYSYTLCPGIPNTAQMTANRGKLTLRKVWFTYENNTRGALSPYKFDYANGRDSSLASYSEFAFDRWGVYKPIISNNPCQNISNPYVNQELSEEQMSELVSSWHLTDIYMPSGSHIKVELGRDHYGYEQNKVAGQMFKIAGVSTFNSNTIDVSDHTLGDVGNLNRKVYFNLEGNGIPQSSPNDIDKYFVGLHEFANDISSLSNNFNSGKQLFFSLSVDLFNQNNSDKNQDISGYAMIENYAVDPTSLTNGYYKRGYVTLKPFALPSKNKYYHPFAVHSWMFIQQNLTDIMYGFYPGTIDGSDSEVSIFFKRIIGVYREAWLMFRDYYRIASNRELASKISLEDSFIRLSTPDKKMYGDGVRVKKVLLYDDWEQLTGEKTPVYGTVYGYDEADGSSSGVAVSTPIIGSGESSLRYVRNYMQTVRKHKDMLSFVEYPLNESYYPGASIGYRRVTVTSLATEYAIRREQGQTTPSELPTGLPNGFATSGVVVNEFYTAKDFPIIAKETPIKEGYKRRYIPMLFVTETSHEYTGSQGYSIELNNMHGQKRSVKNYATDKEGRVLPDFISAVEYEYLHEKQVRTGVYPLINAVDSISILKNEVSILLADIDPSDSSKAKTATMELGVDRELIMDIQSNINESQSVDFSVNLDFLGFTPFVFPMVMIIPTRTIEYNSVRVASTNKIIRRAGILSKITAYDGQSKVITENKAFDKFTGQPLLTTVNNNYDDLIYNYTVPSYFPYLRMGGAYENLNLWFTLTLGGLDCEGYYPLNNLNANVKPLLVEGDEYILRPVNPSNPLGAVNAVLRATLVKRFQTAQGNETFSLALNGSPEPSTTYVAQVVRSGKRNLLTASAGSITALTNPTINRMWDYCTQYLYDLQATTAPNAVCTPELIVEKGVDFLNAILANSSVVNNSGSFYNANTGSSVALNNAYAALIARCDMTLSNNKGFYYDNIFDLKAENSANIFSVLSVAGATAGQNVPSNFYSYLVSETAAGNVLGYRVVRGDCSGAPYKAIISVRIKKQNGFVEEFLLTLSAILCQTTLSNTSAGTVLTPVLSDTLVVPYRSMDSVLAISAARFSDAWSNTIYNNGNTILGENLFQAGKRGIFRSHESWAYADIRQQSRPINLRYDGIVNRVTLFDWANSFTDSCLAFRKWKKTETVVGYANNGEPNESKNILNIYSSALYGYNNNLPIAVGGNAKKYEIGFESFEEYPVVSNVGALTSKESGNITFIPSTDSIVTTETKNIMMGLQSGFFATTDSYTQATRLPYRATLNLVILPLGMPRTWTIDVPVIAVQPYSIVGASTTHTAYKIPQAWSCWLTFLNPKDEKMTLGRIQGTVTLYYKNPPTPSSSVLGISDLASHAGKKSLVIPTGTTTIPQRILQLEAGKQYIFSAWTKVAKPDDYTYALSMNVLLDGAFSMVPSGQIIDGWQRIEGVFTALNTTPLIAVSNTSGQPLYLDDIRIYPKDGSLQTYVYDPVNYKVTETLDANNYMSKYKYDRQGSLISVQKETPKGLKTIQETGSFIKPN